MFNNLTDVVKNLLIINVLVYILLNFTGIGRALFNFFVLYPIHSPYFQPIQLITNMFNHAPVHSELGMRGSIGYMHIFGNMMTLYFFGPRVEYIWGPKKFLFFYLLCGLGADILHLVTGGGPALGASGAISGVLLAFAYMYPEAKVMLLIPPIPLKAKYLVMGLLAFDLYLGITNSQTGIAHFAHIGGAVMGVILIFIFRKYPNFLR